MLKFINNNIYIQNIRAILEKNKEIKKYLYN